jgi:hypothetical protein
MAHSEAVIAKIPQIERGKGPISYRRLELDLARTLVAGHRALPVHPWLHRTISVREAAASRGLRTTMCSAALASSSRSRLPIRFLRQWQAPLRATLRDSFPIQTAEEAPCRSASQSSDIAIGRRDWVRSADQLQRHRIGVGGRCRHRWGGGGPSEASPEPPRFR